MEGGGAKAAYQIPRRRRDDDKGGGGGGQEEDSRDRSGGAGSDWYGSARSGGGRSRDREDHYGGGGGGRGGGRSTGGGGHYGSASSRGEGAAPPYERHSQRDYNDRGGSSYGGGYGMRQSAQQGYQRDARPSQHYGRSPPSAGGGFQQRDDARNHDQGGRGGSTGGRQLARGRVRRRCDEVSQSVSVPKEYGGIVVGKHGKNLQRIGDSADVEISNGYDNPLNPGLLSFTISGTPTAIENAKLQIFYAVSGGFTRDKCEDSFLILNTGIEPQELVQFVPASARQVYGPADTYSLRRVAPSAEAVDDVAKRMEALNLGRLPVEREGRRGVTDSRTAVQRVARLLRETRGFPGKVRLVARLGQITFRAVGQLVMPANKPHAYSTMEPILRDRCTPRFVTITDETETKLAHEALTQLLAEGYAPEAREIYEFKVWDEASHIPLSITLNKNADGQFTLKEAFMVSSKKLICDFLFPTDEPDVRICLDTQRTVEANEPLLDFVRQIRCHTKATAAAESERGNDDERREEEEEEEVLTFPAPPTIDIEAPSKDGEETEESETAAPAKQRFHAFFLRKKSDMIYRLSEDCFVRTTRVSETGFGNGERNRKWETEIEFITATADAIAEDQALEARLESFFDAVLQARSKLHRG